MCVWIQYCVFWIQFCVFWIQFCVFWIQFCVFGYIIELLMGMRVESHPFAFAGLRTLRIAPLLPALRPSNLIALLRCAATNYVALRSKSMAVALINFTTVPSLSVPMVVANVLWRQEQISLPFCQALSFTGPIFSNQDFSPFRILPR